MYWRRSPFKFIILFLLSGIVWGAVGYRVAQTTPWWPGDLTVQWSDLAQPHPWARWTPSIAGLDVVGGDIRLADAQSADILVRPLASCSVLRVTPRANSALNVSLVDAPDLKPDTDGGYDLTKIPTVADGYRVRFMSVGESTITALDLTCVRS